jgi:FtsH-binding integral membrane protein
MANTAPGPRPAVNITDTKQKMRFQLIDTALVFGVFLIALTGIGGAVVIAFNLGEWDPSFWLGLCTLFIIATFLIVLWFNHRMKRFWLGYLFTIVAVIVLVTMLVLFFAFADSFAWDKFSWGLLATGILAIVFAAIKLYGYLSRKAHNR